MVEFSANTLQILQQTAGRKYLFTDPIDEFFPPYVNTTFCKESERIILKKATKYYGKDDEKSSELNTILNFIRNIYNRDNKDEFKAYWTFKKYKKAKSDNKAIYEEINKVIKEEFFKFIENVPKGITINDFDRKLLDFIKSTKEVGEVIRSIEFYIQDNLESPVFKQYWEYSLDDKVDDFCYYPFKWFVESIKEKENSNIEKLTRIFNSLTAVFEGEVFLTTFRKFAKSTLSNTFNDVRDNIEFITKCIQFIKDTKDIASLICEPFKDKIADCMFEPLFGYRFKTDIESIITNILDKYGFESTLFQELANCLEICQSDMINNTFSMTFRNYVVKSIKKAFENGYKVGIEMILEMYKKISTFIPTLIKDFKKAFNEKPLTVAFAYAFYCDALIKERGDELINSIDNIMKLFSEFNAIDSMLLYYIKFLAHRLLSYKEKVPKIEEEFSKVINGLCNNKYSQNIIEMINDTKESLENRREAKDIMKVSDFSIIKYELWPSYDNIDIPFPKVIEDDFLTFSGFYQGKYIKRVLKWLKILDTCTFNVDEVEIECSGLHYCILDSINKGKELPVCKQTDSAVEDLINAKLVEKEGEKYVFIPPKIATKVKTLKELIPIVEDEEQDSQIRIIKNNSLRSLVVLIVKDKKSVSKEDLFLCALSKNLTFSFSKEELYKTIDTLVEQEYLSSSSDGMIHFDI